MSVTPQHNNIASTSWLGWIFDDSPNSYMAITHLSSDSELDRLCAEVAKSRLPAAHYNYKVVKFKMFRINSQESVSICISSLGELGIVQSIVVTLIGRFRVFWRRWQTTIGNICIF